LDAGAHDYNLLCRWDISAWLLRMIESLGDERVSSMIKSH